MHVINRRIAIHLLSSTSAHRLVDILSAQIVANGQYTFVILLLMCDVFETLTQSLICHLVQSAFLFSLMFTVCLMFMQFSYLAPGGCSIL